MAVQAIPRAPFLEISGRGVKGEQLDGIALLDNVNDTDSRAAQPCLSSRLALYRGRPMRIANEEHQLLCMA